MIDDKSLLARYGKIPDYSGLRTSRYLYVEYANGEREYYDLKSDPYELTNTYRKLPPAQVDALHSELARLETCRFVATCQHR